MNKYQIGVSITIRAEDEAEAREMISVFLNHHTQGTEEITDFSIEETQDVYGDREWKMSEKN